MADGNTVDLEDPLVAASNALGDALSQDWGDAAGFRQFSYVRRRPMHPERFFAFIRRRFGPLEQDHLMSSSSEGPAPVPWPTQLRPGHRTAKSAENANDANAISESSSAVEVEAAGGCLWFIGSDDIRAEWRFQVASKKNGLRHLLRCGNQWAVDSEVEESSLLECEKGREGPTAGHRRIALIFWISVSASQESASEKSSSEEAAVSAWETTVVKELNECLITREEAVRLESGDHHILGNHCEWEAIRAAHDNMVPWVARAWPVLGAVKLVAGVVSRIPGFTWFSAFGGAVSQRLIRGYGQQPAESTAEAAASSEASSATTPFDRS
eukprot:TRINITY_DN35881_c0_g1_i1.p1 TRINITY_DN35881_c0_g1~~TRINITY_DN35881_c0_g1_i1.p1  ORF type:complete len:326 (+),score=46.55 TRINITY_DN35881_c0_g1_i1:71-1048(+)